MAAKKYRNYIAGEWADPTTGQYQENHNPADQGEVLGLFPRSSAEDVERAVDAAREAYTRWRKVPAPKRGEILFKVARRLEQEKAEIAKDMTREMGKILEETEGDTQEAIDTAYFMAGEGRRLHGYTTPSELPDKAAYCIRVPVGVAGIITPWNFPMAIPSWKILPALLCGDTVVFKPASDTPLTAYRFVRIFEDCGVPPGVVNLVMGSGGTVGDAIVDHPKVDLISFTGSSEVGRTVYERAARTFKRVGLEMGGKNPIIVMEDASLELAVEGSIWGAYGTSGQRCTAASRIIVHDSIYKAFVDAFVERANHLKVGNGLNPDTQMGPIINGHQLESIDRYVHIGEQEGAHLRCGGHRLTGGDYDNGFFYAPTVFADVQPGMRIEQEEIFGPVVSILRFETLEEAITIANDVDYGLSSSIYTNDVRSAMVAIDDLEAGITYINAPSIGAEIHLPFGGVKQTGNGHREGGETVLDIFSEWKSVYIDYSSRLQRAQIDTDKVVTLDE